MGGIIETKICKKCQANFEITDQDALFYKKMEVSFPTMCPACRMQRLMAFRNERALFKAKCAYTGEDMLSVYPPDTKYVVYDQKTWWSDKWNAFDYGMEFDFSRPFFEQLQELAIKIPRINLDNRSNENSDYCNDTNDLKDCYLCFNAEEAQNFYYCTSVGYGKDCMDLFWVMQCELCYECTKTFGAYHCFYCFNCSNISDCYFCKNLIGCKNCFGCIGLHQQEYCIFNKKVGKEKFEEFMLNFKFTYPNIEKTKRDLEEFNLKNPHKNLEIVQSENCLGDYITNSKNCQDCFDMMDSEDCRYVWDGIVKNACDCFNVGIESAFLYECLAIYRANNAKFSNKCSSVSDVYYCEHCFQTNNSFGCICLNHQKYCILNKQYSKEEYEKLLPRIIEHMKKTGEWGEFCPPLMSHVGYNDSIAQYYIPLTREEAKNQGFHWNDYEKINAELESVEGKNLPDSIDEVSNDILSKRIKCEHDEKYFRIIQQELDFYKKHGIALPHLCPDCRHFARKAQINPRKLYDRKCQKCGIEVKSTYSPNHPEIVCCEKCYLETVI